ncbi:hypothetical protein ABIA38_002806 [Embleya sp. AB8]
MNEGRWLTMRRTVDLGRLAGAVCLPSTTLL